MRCQIFRAPLGALPVIAPFRGCASHQFTGGLDLRTLKAAFLKITDSSILQEISKSGMILLMYRYFLTMANGLISHITYNG